MKPMIYFLFAFSSLLVEISGPASLNSLRSLKLGEMDRGILIDNIRHLMKNMSKHLEGCLASTTLKLGSHLVNQFDVINKKLCSKYVYKISRMPRVTGLSISCFCRTQCWQLETFLSLTSPVCEEIEKNLMNRTKSRRSFAKVPLLYVMTALKVLVRVANWSEERKIQNVGKSIDAFFAKPEDRDPLVKIGLAGNFVSAFSLILLIVTYVIMKKHKGVPGKNTICLSVCLACANAIQVIATYGSGIRLLCITTGVLLHWFLLSSFCWMSALAYEYFVTFHKIRLVTHAAKFARFKTSCGVSFTLPSVAVVVCLLLDIPNRAITQYGVAEKCFVVGFWANLFAFVAPVALMLSTNIGLLCFTVYDLWLASRITQPSTYTANRRKVFPTLIAMKLSVLVGGAWMVGFIQSMVPNTALAYIYVIVVTFQGLFIYLAFGQIGVICCQLRNRICVRVEEMSDAPIQLNTMPPSQKRQRRPHDM